jgi:hypothetical protein
MSGLSNEAKRALGPPLASALREYAKVRVEFVAANVEFSRGESFEMVKLSASKHFNVDINDEHVLEALQLGFDEGTAQVEEWSLQPWAR